LLAVGVGLLLAIVGFTAAADFQSHITPASVSVSGYYRNDGTYVHGYNRRPPGSVNRDSPYELGMLLFGVIGIVGCTLIIGGVHAYRSTTDDVIVSHLTKETLQNMNFKINLPQKPYGLVNSAISTHTLNVTIR